MKVGFQSPNSAIDAKFGPSGKIPSGEQTADTFMSLLSPSTKQAQPGPEPPPEKGPPQPRPPGQPPLVSPPPDFLETGKLAEQGAETDAEEAATSPNAKSLKLDSPRPEKKSQAPEASPSSITGINSGATTLAQNSVQSVGEDSKSSPERRSSRSLSIDSISTVSHAGEDATDLSAVKSHGALPVDPDVPITSIRTFTAERPTTTAPSGDIQQSEVSSNSVVTPSTVSAKLINPPNPSTAPITEPPTVAAITAEPTLHRENPPANLVAGTPAHRDSAPGSISPAGAAPQSGFQDSAGHGGSLSNNSRRPDPQTATSSFDKHTKVADVVAKFETMMAVRPQNGVTVELSPKSLGQITFTLKTFGKEVDTHFSASDPSVRQALSETKTDLSSSMNSRGYTVTGMSVNGQSAGSGGGSYPSNSDHPFLAKPLAKSAGPDSTGQPASPLTPSVRSLSNGMDLWI